LLTADLAREPDDESEFLVAFPIRFFYRRRLVNRCTNKPNNKVFANQ